MNSFAVRSLVAGALGALAFAAPAAAAPGDVIVLDNSGALNAVNPATGKVTLLSDDAKSKAAGGQALFGSDIFGVAREPSGSYVVIARRGSTSSPNRDASRVIRVDPTTGAQSLISSDSALTFGVNSVAVGPGGDIFVGDEYFPDKTLGGGIYRVDPGSGKLTVVASNDTSAAAGGRSNVDGVMGLVADGSGLWMLDDIAGDPDRDDQHGGILKVDGGRFTQVSSNAISSDRGGPLLYNDPRAFARAAGGDFYVVDNAGINNPKFGAADAKLIRVNSSTGVQSLVSDNARSKSAGGSGLFSSPYGVAVEPSGSVLVVDSGKLLRIDPSTGKQSLVAQGLGNSLALTIVPGTPSGGSGTTGGGTTGGGGGGTTGGDPGTPSGGALPAELRAAGKSLVRALTKRTGTARSGRVTLGQVAADAFPDGTAISLKLGRLGSVRVVTVPGQSASVVLKLKSAGKQRLKRAHRLSGKLAMVVRVPGYDAATFSATLRIKG